MGSVFNLNSWVKIRSVTETGRQEPGGATAPKGHWAGTEEAKM